MIPGTAKLLGTLSGNDVTFFIPPYQRNYEWDKEHCEVFFRDVVETARKNIAGEETEHFFGSVTYFQDETPFGQPNKLVLIDGQQRITTTMLFLVALRDLTEEQATKDFIDSKYLRNNNVSDDTEYKIKLKQVETDWKAYCDIILGEEINEHEKRSTVYQNYVLFKRLLTEKGYPCEMTDLVEKGLNKFSIITIELEPEKNKWENPQEIFESMNSLGKLLTLADLVRNYLLLGMPASEQEILYKKYWLQIEGRLNNISDFIRDYMQLLDKKAYVKASDRNSKDLYAGFKELFRGKDTSELISDLNRFSKYYSYIVMDIDCGCAPINRRLKDLRMIGVTTSYSFIMGLLHSWDEGRISNKDMEDVLAALFIYFMRRRIISLTQGENKSIPELSKRIQEIEDADNKKEVTFKILSEQESNLRIPNDIEMERTLKAMNFYNFKYAKFIMTLMEESITKNRPSMDDTKLQIEHIMPQTIDAEKEEGRAWIEELGSQYEDIHQEWQHNIGNLTLIRHNQELGNKSFVSKKDIYTNKAGLQIAKTEITNREKWNEESIQNRFRWVVDLLLKKVIAIPDHMRRINNFTQKESNALSFMELQLIGEEITYINDRSVVVKVVSDAEVEFEGKKWRLSPLTKELETRRGTVRQSGSYRGAEHWEYEGIRLLDIM